MRQAVQTLLVLIVSEDTEQIEEEIHEVEIESQGSEKCHLLHVFAGVGCELQEMLYLLRVVSGESYEDEHADVAQNEVESGTLHKHVHDGGDDESDESHEEQLAHGGEVGLRGVAYECHYGECSGGDEEHLTYGSHAEHEEDA